MFQFNGPLFIIGMPRSGTKLVRDLLNQNPRIAISTTESQFIPFFVRKFGESPRFDNEAELDAFYQEFSQTVYFSNNQRKGKTLPRSAFDSLVDKTKWEHIVEVIFRYYAPAGTDPHFIWGDKTPGYLNHTPLLKRLFPTAKFLHILRDPRDYCLSVRNSWGKSIYRAADLWNNSVRKGHIAEQKLGHDYLEIRYEALLSQPEATLRQVCDFLHCPFTPVMLTLNESPEKRGATKGATTIVAGNQRKYLTAFTPSEVQRIEEIVYPVAQKAGYSFEHANQHKPLNPLWLRTLSAYDGYASIKMHVLDKGLVRGFRYATRLHHEKTAV